MTRCLMRTGLVACATLGGVACHAGTIARGADEAAGDASVDTSIDGGLACPADSELAPCVDAASMCDADHICTESLLCRPLAGETTGRCDPSAGLYIAFCMPDETALEPTTDFSGTVVSVGGGELLLDDGTTTLRRLTYSIGPYDLPVSAGDLITLRYGWSGPWTCASGVVITRDGEMVFGGTTTWGVLRGDIGVPTERVGLCCAFEDSPVIGGGGIAGVPMGLRVGLGPTIVGSGEEAPIDVGGVPYTFVAGYVFDMACTCEDVGTQPSFFVIRN